MEDQLLLFEDEEIPLYQLFEAYYDCRRHKRKTKEAIAFERDLEVNLIQLWAEINHGTYRIGPSSVFIVDSPVKREIFAAGFRDRIVHHLLVRLIGPVIEHRLIYDCYACRDGKGTSLGIERLRHAMASCSNNYQTPAWVLKLDVHGFFMSIDRRILWKNLKKYLVANYQGPALRRVLMLCHQVLTHDPVKDCIYRCQRQRWKGLPASKSLFHVRKGCGLPIGNLTSQVFANFYMSYLDHYVKHDLKIRWYGRYVDDFYLVHPDRAYLVDCMHKIARFLKQELHLSLNEKKKYLQPATHGVKFLGTSIQPFHTNMSRRIIRGAFASVTSFNHLNHAHRLNRRELRHLRSSVNSYLGMMTHYQTYRIRVSLIAHIEPRVMARLKVPRAISKVGFS